MSTNKIQSIDSLNGEELVSYTEVLSELTNQMDQESGFGESEEER